MSEEAKKEIENLDIDNADALLEPSEYTEVEEEQLKEGWIPPDREDQLEGKKFLTAVDRKRAGK